MRDDLLIEIGVEEMPPTSLANLSDAFHQVFASALDSAGLVYSRIQPFATPRRLALYIHDLAEQAPDREKVLWGPPISVAFDAADQPTKAAVAFAAKSDVSIDQLKQFVEHDKKQARLCVRQIKGGERTTDLLESMLNLVLKDLPIPKRMRWGSRRDEFVRPVRWAVLLFGTCTVAREIVGVVSSNRSRGHRFHAPDELVISSPKHYQQQMREAKVLVDSQERREIIETGINQLARSYGGRAVISEALLDEVTALCEWPVPLLGVFEERFLHIPAECLISAMQRHQKYFHILDDNGQLLPAFITVANISSLDPLQVVAGNERVIRPRLADAEFFYKSDLQRTLTECRQDLKRVVFQSQLGSVFDKTERISALSQSLAVYTGADPDRAERAGRLCKSDLISNMVAEFDDLQGIMGRYYAINDGEELAIANAVREHYLPRFSGDRIPTETIGITLAIADRLDTLVGIFSIGQQPTGSKDPFALRRASLGLLRVIIEAQVDIDLPSAISKAAIELRKTGIAVPEKVEMQVFTYITERYIGHFKEQGIGLESYQAVAALNIDKPLDLNARVCAVDKFSRRPEAAILIAANRRVANILAKHPIRSDTVQEHLFEENAEKALAKIIEETKPQITKHLNERQYDQALELLTALRETIDCFFDHVMVMAEAPDIRANRLALLQQLRALFLGVADISLLSSNETM